jgi:putative endonuclease
MYYVYVLKSIRHNRLYFGVTNDVKRRLSEHNDGMSISTRPYRPYALVYFEAYLARSDAERREQRIKRYGQGYRQIRERISDSLLNVR